MDKRIAEVVGWIYFLKRDSDIKILYVSKDRYNIINLDNKEVSLEVYSDILVLKYPKKDAIIYKCIEIDKADVIMRFLGIELDSIYLRFTEMP